MVVLRYVSTGQFTIFDLKQEIIYFSLEQTLILLKISSTEQNSLEELVARKSERRWRCIKIFVIFFYSVSKCGLFTVQGLIYVSLSFSFLYIYVLFSFVFLSCTRPHSLNTAHLDLFYCHHYSLNLIFHFRYEIKTEFNSSEKYKQKKIPPHLVNNSDIPPAVFAKVDSGNTIINTRKNGQWTSCAGYLCPSKYNNWRRYEQWKSIIARLVS